MGGGKVVIPGWVPIRPGTDGALALALCYVLYRRGLYDTTYLSTTTNRKCFGFYKDDSVTSLAPEKSGNFQFKFHKAVTGEDGTSYTADAPFKGKTFTVPTGKSFEEILVNLENGVDAKGWATSGKTAGSLNTSDLTSGATNAANYSEVLEYASRLTGVKSEVIEALAYHFAKTDPSKVDAGCGPQRQYAGAEWVWLVICFTVMCGHVEKKGGGLPIGMGSFPDNWVIGTKEKKAVTGTGFIYNIPTDKTADSYINIMDQNLAEIVLTGRDGRTAAQFKKDNSLTVDTGKTPSIGTLDNVKIRLYTMSASNRLITHPNTNKTIEAYKDIEMVVVCDQVMTPSAAYADIVLPAATHLEDVGGIGGQGEISILKQNVLRKTMYETKRQGEITATYKRKCAEALGLDLAKYPAYSTPTDLDNSASSKTTVENYATSTLWDTAVNENITMPTWEDYAKKGSAQVVTPADKPIMGLVHHHKPGVDLETSTGYINFWSPFWGLARYEDLATMTGSNLYTDGDFSAGWRVTTANYVPVREGYEKFFTGGSVWGNFEGYPSKRKDGTFKYKLQFMTNKARNRAHTCQDNVAIIKDQFEQKVYINPIDAAERLIKDGDLVYVYNDRGCTKIRASVTNYIVPGVISVEHGAWYRAATDPKETVTVYIPTEYDAQDIPTEMPVDLGGCENLLTDDRFVYDPVFIHQTAGCHGGPVEVSLTKPEA